MRRRTLHAPHEAGKINVTPMIDVVMVLIVFFLIVGKLAAERYASVDLPFAAAARASGSGEPLVVNVTPGEGGASFIVDGIVLGAPGVERVVREARAEDSSRTVRIRADRALPYGAVRPAIEACRRAGVRRVLLATEGG